MNESTWDDREEKRTDKQEANTKDVHVHTALILLDADAARGALLGVLANPLPVRFGEFDLLLYPGIDILTRGGAMIT